MHELIPHNTVTSQSKAQNRKGEGLPYIYQKVHGMRTASHAITRTQPRQSTRARSPHSVPQPHTSSSSTRSVLVSASLRHAPAAPSAQGSHSKPYLREHARRRGRGVSSETGLTRPPPPPI